MRTASAALWAALYALPLFAQLPSGFPPGTPYRKSATAPASCSLHQLWYDTAETTWKECTVAGTPGTWTTVGTGSSLGTMAIKDALGTGAYGLTGDGGLADNEVIISTSPDGKAAGSGVTASGGALNAPAGITTGSGSSTSKIVLKKLATSTTATPDAGWKAIGLDVADGKLYTKDENDVVVKVLDVGDDRSPAIGCAFDGGGSTITVDSICYARATYACTITGWTIEAVGSSPTATIDVLKIATGTTLPTASIAASALPALATGNALASTTLTGWTTSVAANDMLGFNVDAVSNATWLAIRLKCQ